MKLKNITVKGMISYYNEMDNEEHEFAILGADDDSEDYIVAKTSLSKKLEKFVHKYVKVTGDIKYDKNNNKVMTIKGIQLLK